MLLNIIIPNKGYKMILKYPRFMLLFHTAFWYVIGILFHLLLSIVPFYENIEFFQEPMNLAAILSMILGFMGGVFILCQLESDTTNLRELS